MFKILIVVTYDGNRVQAMTEKFSNHMDAMIAIEILNKRNNDLSVRTSAMALFNN